ncbi:hypothetical protein [Eisenibacter elegans]|uniref:hypothetical protein n=1 Tax=Eisenibacter elegans TaxID=997 RepID=UPI000414198D|nr:hypothetical protein [Eisenibacter elegans]
MMLMIVYLFVFTLSLSLVAWLMVRTFRGSDLPPNGGDDGGTPGDSGLPVIDLPPGGAFEDILVDRWHDDSPKTTRKN